MNYYEELGIRADAEAEDIRKAHRRLVKLMHPDHQRDPHMKVLAETQMRRLNTIVSTLLDPDQRGEYDEALRGRYLARPVATRTWRGVSWWLVSSVAAGILMVGAVWIWADHIGNSASTTPTYIPPREPHALSKTGEPSNTAQAPIAEPKPAVPNRQVASAPSLSSSRPSEKVEGGEGRNVPAGPALTARPLPQPPKSTTPNPVTSIHAAANDQTTERAALGNKKFHLPPGILPSLPNRSQATTLPPAPGFSTPTHVDTASFSFAPLPIAAAPKPDVPNPALQSRNRLSASPANALEGEWVYAPKEPEKHRAGFYPPEFINLKLSQQHQGGMQGQYSARYEVSGTNKPISPEVSFDVVATDKEAHKFIWHSSNGSRGTLVIHAIDGHTIRLEWRTTVPANSPVLTSGIATLVRKE